MTEPWPNWQSRYDSERIVTDKDYHEDPVGFHEHFRDQSTHLAKMHHDHAVQLVQVLQGIDDEDTKVGLDRIVQLHLRAMNSHKQASKLHEGCRRHHEDMVSYQDDKSHHPVQCGEALELSAQAALDTDSAVRAGTIKWTPNTAGRKQARKSYELLKQISFANDDLLRRLESIHV